MTEWYRLGLQNRSPRFNSGSHIQITMESLAERQRHPVVSRDETGSTPVGLPKFRLACMVCHGRLKPD